VSRLISFEDSVLRSERGGVGVPVQEALRILSGEIGFRKGAIDRLPFVPADTTAGTETEMQAAVRGARSSVELPCTIDESNYYANIVRRAAAGDTPNKAVIDIERYLSENREGVWENSFVRVPLAALNPLARRIFREDLRANKGCADKGLRNDAARFTIFVRGKEYLRVPVSYLLKLALADVIGEERAIPEVIQETGYRLMEHFTNDNTSPETQSFHVITATDDSALGKNIAEEMAFRYLLTQLLVIYANERFLLKVEGQEALVYFSPHPPVRQKILNGCVSDVFYRELFMSPCLSGWDEGEVKHRYMHLCHEVLSRSQLNGVRKLREAGIIVSNLVVLPEVSNISLANNGIHLSLGSRNLTRLLEDGSSGFTKYHEKAIGDLVVKIMEHFLPLFVGTYTASPYRIDYGDFHPEKVLGFLPHELDYTHLRMIWRRWKGKAKIKIFNRALTPFGPPWLDGLLSGLFNLKGDFVPDFRLIDYLVCVMSTESSPALDGMWGNTERLKNDLAELGVFHRTMSLYLFCKQREYGVMGFSGFEGRHFSLFESFEKDMAVAGDLQNLLTALAFKYVLEGKVNHGDIPDTPFAESERRQVVFDAAIGMPTFFVKLDSGNRFMQRIVARTHGIRQSRRYPGYLRIDVRAYLNSLVDIIREDGAPLVEMFGMEEALNDLKARLEGKGEQSALLRLLAGILDEAGESSPFDVNGETFNAAAERFYREGLQKRHMTEALGFLERSLDRMEETLSDRDDAARKGFLFCGGQRGARNLIERSKMSIQRGEYILDEVKRCIHLVLLLEHVASTIHQWRREEHDNPPVCRAGNS
jgi:hypothetical protein